MRFLELRTVYRITAALAAVALTCLVSQDTVAKTKKVHFKGKQLFEKRTGLTVLPDDDRTDVMVSSIHHHYRLVLPYSENWLFETDHDLPLLAQDDTYTVSIAIVPKDGDTASERLQLILKRLRGSAGTELRDPTFLKAYERPILRYKARFASLPKEFGDTAPWVWNYWTAVSRESDWYVLHVSTEAESDIPPDEKDPTVLKRLGAGFGADFDVD